MFAKSINLSNEIDLIKIKIGFDINSFYINKSKLHRSMNRGSNYFYDNQSALKCFNSIIKTVYSS